MGHLQGSLLHISRHLQQGMLHWFRDGMFIRQLDPYERHLQHEMSTMIPRWDVYRTVWSVCPVWEATVTRNVYIDSEMGCLQDSLGVWKASATGNVYLDSEMGHLQDALICTRGICNRKCLHRFWDGTFTRQFDLYERHLQQEMSTSILRWDIYNSLIRTRGIYNMNQLNHWVVWHLHDKAFFESKFYLYE